MGSRVFIARMGILEHLGRVIRYHCQNVSPSLSPPPLPLFSTSFLPSSPPSSSPGYDCPETVALQVYCEGRVLAQTEFTFYANTQYHSDQLFSYLVQNMPQYFQMDDISGE